MHTPRCGGQGAAASRAACNEEPCAVAVHAGCAAKSRQEEEGPSPRGQTRVIVGVRSVSGLVSSTFVVSHLWLSHCAG